MIVPRVLLVALAVVCASCHRSADRVQEHAPKPTTQGEHEDEPEHGELTRHVRLTADVIQDAGIKVQASVREPLAVPIELPGELVADPDRSAQVSPRIAGRIEQVLFHEGQVVSIGDL